MPAKLTNDEVDKRLRGRKIRRIDNIDGCSKRIMWKCEKCDNEWITTPVSILNNEQGCPKCSHRSYVYTNEEIDEKLKVKRIERLGTYINIETPILFKCLVCKYTWETEPTNIINHNYGCKQCSGNIRHTNDSIDMKMKGRYIQRVGNVKNAHAKILWKCIKDGCGYEWKSTIHAIVNHNAGCPKCLNKVPLSNIEVDKRLENKKILRVGDVNTNRIPIIWKCLEIGCGHEWKSTPYRILNTGVKCPKCTNKLPINNEEVDKRLFGKNIKRLEDVDGTEHKIKWQCTKENCGYVWRTSYHGLSGCARCNGRELYSNEVVDRKLKNRNILRLENIIDKKIKIKWKCLTCDHIWSAFVSGVAGGTGCPLCKFKNQQQVYRYLATIIDEKNLVFNSKKIYYTDKNHFRLDFFINPNLIIEYNGMQHYKPVEFFGGEDKFKKQQIRDELLRKYCIENNFKLLEIPYTMKEEEWKQKIYDFLLTNLSEESLSDLSFSRLETIYAPIAPPTL